MKTALAIIGSLATTSLPSLSNSLLTFDQPQTPPIVSGQQPTKPGPVDLSPVGAKPEADKSPLSEVERLTNELTKRRADHKSRLDTNSETIERQLKAEIALSVDLEKIQAKIETEVTDKTKKITEYEKILQTTEGDIKKIRAEGAEIKKSCDEKKGESDKLTKKLEDKKKASEQIAQHIKAIREAIETWEKTDFVKVQHDPDKVIKLSALDISASTIAFAGGGNTYDLRIEPSPPEYVGIDLRVATTGVGPSILWPIIFASLGNISEPPTHSKDEEIQIAALKAELEREDATFDSWSAEDVVRIKRNWEALKVNKLSRDQLLSQFSNLQSSFDQRLEQLERKQNESSKLLKQAQEDLKSLSKRSGEEIKNHDAIDKDFTKESKNLSTLEKRKGELQEELRKVVKKAETRVHSVQVYTETTHGQKTLWKNGHYEAPPPKVRQMGHGLTLNNDGTVTRGAEKDYLKGRNLRWKVEYKSNNGHAEEIRRAPALNVPELKL